MSTRFYDTDLTDAAWAFVAPVLPAAFISLAAASDLMPRARRVRLSWATMASTAASSFGPISIAPIMAITSTKPS